MRDGLSKDSTFAPLPRTKADKTRVVSFSLQEDLSLESSLAERASLWVSQPHTGILTCPLILGPVTHPHSMSRQPVDSCVGNRCLWSLVLHFPVIFYFQRFLWLSLHRNKHLKACILYFIPLLKGIITGHFIPYVGIKRDLKYLKFAL